MKRKILVVERDEDILQILTEILTTEGYKVITSSTETGMLEKIKREKPDAVLLDIVKPTPLGTELCEAVKKLNSVAVIVLSTYMDISAFLDICADKVISKPFDITELINVIENQIVHQSGSNQPID